MHKKFGINRTKIKGSCLSGRKVVTHDSKSDLPLAHIFTWTLQDCTFEENAAVLDLSSDESLLSMSLLSKQRFKIEKQDSCASLTSSDTNGVVLSTIQMQAASFPVSGEVPEVDPPVALDISPLTSIENRNEQD